MNLKILYIVDTLSFCSTVCRVIRIGFVNWGSLQWSGDRCYVKFYITQTNTLYFSRLIIIFSKILLTFVKKTSFLDNRKNKFANMLFKCSFCTKDFINYIISTVRQINVDFYDIIFIVFICSKSNVFLPRVSDLKLFA